MKLILFIALFLSMPGFGQLNSIAISHPSPQSVTSLQMQPSPAVPAKADIRIDRSKRWRMNGNKILTGGLIFLSGAAKGFNEGLQFNYFGFEDIFQKPTTSGFTRLSVLKINIRTATLPKVQNFPVNFPAGDAHRSVSFE